MFDVLIVGGKVVDGTNSPGYAADVGIVGGAIDAIGDLRLSGKSSTGDMVWKPALLTRTSTRPRTSNACWHMRRVASMSEISA